MTIALVAHNLTSAESASALFGFRKSGAALLISVAALIRSFMQCLSIVNEDTPPITYLHPVTVTSLVQPSDI